VKGEAEAEAGQEVGATAKRGAVDAVVAVVVVGVGTPAEEEEAAQRKTVPMKAPTATETARCARQTGKPRPSPPADGKPS
jgi:hypothetical protein